MNYTEGVTGIKTIDDTASKGSGDSGYCAAKLTGEKTADEAVGCIRYVTGDASDSDEGVTADETCDRTGAGREDAKRPIRRYLAFTIFMSAYI